MIQVVPNSNPPSFNKEDFRYQMDVKKDTESMKTIDDQFEIPIPPKVIQNTPSTPSSFKVSRSDVSESSHDTNPSSIDGNQNRDDEVDTITVNDLVQENDIATIKVDQLDGQSIKVEPLDGQAIKVNQVDGQAIKVNQLDGIIVDTQSIKNANFKESRHYGYRDGSPSPNTSIRMPSPEVAHKLKQPGVSSPALPIVNAHYTLAPPSVTPPILKSGPLFGESATIHTEAAIPAPPGAHSGTAHSDVPSVIAHSAHAAPSAHVSHSAHVGAHATPSAATPLLGGRRHTLPVGTSINEARVSLDVTGRTSVDFQADYPRHSISSGRPFSFLLGRALPTRSTFPAYESETVRLRNSLLLKRSKSRRSELDDDKVLVGNKISEGHQNFVMAYNMLTGIRVAVSRCSGVMEKLSDADFKSSKKLSFNMDGSELTPSSKYDFKFKDYCPEVFREMRSMFGLDPADYLVSITGKYILSELGSPGKSGSFFYYSRDFRFIIKTIHHAEHKQLRRILKDYYNHVKENPNTLISQFYGLHRVKMPFSSKSGGSRKVHFVVMNNLFPPHRDIHLKYDLKGSTWGRVTPTPEDEDISLKTLKDLNFLDRKESINFGPYKKKLFFDQLEKDVKLLKKINVMDYSLLLGVHDVKKGNTFGLLNKLSVFDPKSSDKKELIKTNPRGIDPQLDLPSNVFPGRSQYIFYGHDGGIRSTGELNEPLQQIYYLGIIDCLTNYSTKKRLETFWRGMFHNRLTISALPAGEYGDRFVKFIKKGCGK